MPNWSSTNFVLVGSEKDIRRFCDTINSCHGKPDVAPNDYGKLWLGNICAALGIDWEKVDEKFNICGTLIPDPCYKAQWCGPDPDDSVEKLIPEKIENSANWKIAFSTCTAWDRCNWFDELFKSQFPNCRYGWRATDEFGNFHKVFNPELTRNPSIELYVPDICDDTYNWGEEEKAAAKLTEITGMPFSREELNDFNEGFWKKVNEWNKAHEDNWIDIDIWDLVTD